MKQTPERKSETAESIDGIRDQRQWCIESRDGTKASPLIKILQVPSVRNGPNKMSETAFGGRHEWRRR